MSQLFKNLKSIFVIEGAKTPKQEKQVESKEERAVNDAKAPKMVIKVDVPAGEVNQKFTDILLKAIEANNQEGFDYLEFKRSLQNLLKMNMPEETTFKSAYAASETMGATPGGLVKSAEQYLQVLQREEEKFRVALASQRVKQIDGRMEEMQQMKAGVQQKEARIKELEAEISADRARLTKAEETIQAAAAKVETTSKDFQVSYDNLVKQIQDDISNIDKHLSNS